MAQPGPVAATSSDVLPATTWASQSLSYSEQQIRQEEQSSQALVQLPQLETQDQHTGRTLIFPVAGGDNVAATDLSSQRNATHFKSGPNVAQQDSTAPSDLHGHSFTSYGVGHSEYIKSTTTSYYQQTNEAHTSVPPPASQGYEAQPPFEVAYPGAAGSYQVQETGSSAPSYFPPQPQPVDSHQHGNQDEKEPESSGGLLVTFYCCSALAITKKQATSYDIIDRDMLLLFVTSLVHVHVPRLCHFLCQEM